MISATTNLAELVGMRQYEQQTQAVNRSIERLATGKRINRAKDDPAGLIAADGMAARAAAVSKQIKHLEVDQHRLAAKEGAYSVIGDLLLDLSALTVHAANTGALSPEERDAIQIEADSIVEGIDFIFQTTTFNGQKVFEGMTSASFGLDEFKAGGALNLVDGDLEASQARAESLGTSVSESRAGLGALQKDFYEHELNLLHREFEGLASAESLIRDTDYAREVSELVRSQILQEAALQAILISRDSARSSALSLLG